MVRHGEDGDLQIDTDNGGSAARLELLASALSGRSVRVAFGEPGEPAWTDGQVVFIDAAADAREQVDSIAVQASLLAAGSLDADIAHRLKRRPVLARRYLSIEGHRALGAMADVLPTSVRSLIDSRVAAGIQSPAESLAMASTRKAMAAPPCCFGTIRPRHLLASIRRARESEAVRLQRSETLVELAEDDAADDGNADFFSSPVGGGGSLGRLLGQLLAAVRRLEGGGSPGADVHTHWTRGAPRGRSTELSSGMAGALREAGVERHGVKYPEWDHHRRTYRRDWCTVREVQPRSQDSATLLVEKEYSLRRSLARLGTGLDRCHRRAQGDEIDIDAAIEARVDAMVGAAPNETIYIDSLRRRRDLAVLLLLDTSGSVAEAASDGTTVHEQQRAAAAALLIALHDLGDRAALYAYSSQGRSNVHVMPVKRFDEGIDGRVMQRLQGLVPGAYSRLGAAIRHGARVLEERGGTSRRLLVVLSDGLAYDHGYEPAYGAADARRALAEARRRGTGCLCLSVGASTDADTLERVFGSAAHALIPRPELLSRLIGPLFRAALRSAEVPRQMERRS